MDSYSFALCHKCGAQKKAPLQTCWSCGSKPVTDEELALAFMLTNQFLPEDKLETAAQLIRSGKRIELPPNIRAAVLAAIQTGRAQEQSTQKTGHRKVLGMFLVGTLVFMYLLFASGPQFLWTSFWGTTASYERYVHRFPDSSYTNKAREKIRILREDKVWKEALADEGADKIRDYLQTYPNGKHEVEANERINEIAESRWESLATSDSKKDIQKFLKEFPDTPAAENAKFRLSQVINSKWESVAKSRSVTELRQFLKDYPEASKSNEVEARIRQLSGDWNWVKEQDSLEYYRQFLAIFPYHPQKEWIERRIIDLEVKAIAAGEYGEMPRAQALSYGGTVVEVEVENQTAYELTVRYSGPDSKKLIVPKGGKRTISLVPGNYKVAASVAAANVSNYYGKDDMEGGHYSSSFYIQTSYGRGYK